MHGLVIQLKNGVGDLRAEWLLIKREVHGIKTETLRLQVSHIFEVILFNLHDCGS